VHNREEWRSLTIQPHRWQPPGEWWTGEKKKEEEVLKYDICWQQFPWFSWESTYHRLCISLQAYLGEHYPITILLVLISFGGWCSPQKIFGEQLSRHFPSTASWCYVLSVIMTHSRRLAAVLVLSVCRVLTVWRISVKIISAVLCCIGSLCKLCTSKQFCAACAWSCFCRLFHCDVLFSQGKCNGFRHIVASA